MTRSRDRLKKAAAPVAFSAVGALVATTALLYPGFETAELDLHDSGIWVTHDQGGMIGHLNYTSSILDGGVRPPVEDFELHQEDGNALMLDPASGALTGIDAATMAVGDPAMLPVTEHFALGGGAFSASDAEEGTVYAGTLGPAPQLAGEGPLYEGDGPVASTTTQNGQVLVADLETAEVVRFDRPDQPGGPFTEAGTHALNGLDSLGAPEMTAVGDVPVVVDTNAGRVLWPGGSVQDDRLVGAVPQPAGPVAGSVALSTGSHLVTVGLDGGEVTTLPLAAPDDAAAGGSTPGGQVPGSQVTAPVSVAGCTHAASVTTGYYLRDCEGEAGDEVVGIPDLKAGSELVFRVNRDTVVLNDTASGTSWMVLEQMKVVSNWDDLEPPKSKGEQTDQESDDVTQETALPDREEENRPPVAEDDTFGVRAGRTTQLPVLANDSDPDGDVLTASPAGEQPALGTVQRILDGVGLQVVVPDSATGSATVSYEADDGRGGTDMAQATLRVVPDTQNSAPRQDRVPVLRVPAGESVSGQMLPDWIDPDGDDMQLVGALAEQPDTVRTRPDGHFTFQDNTGEPGTREVEVTVSDGRETATGTVQVEVLERGSIQPPVTQADHVTVQAGQEATFHPLENDEDPLGGQLRLAHVGSAEGVEVSYSTSAGTVQLAADTPGTYYLGYVAANEFDSADGLIRVDVEDSDAGDGLPVAVRDTALLPAGGQVLVNVLGNDTDPAGGVLVVQGAEPATTASGEEAPLKLAVEDLHHIRVVDAGGLSGPATFTYRVSNAEGTSSGEVTVVPLPEPEVMEPPVAVADTAVVRVGDVVTVDVLANDLHPNNEDLTLAPALAKEPTAQDGTGFVSDGTVRFRAGNEPGRASLAYTVSGPDGQQASATVDITMLPMDRAANNPPVPETVSARVLAGESVVVPVPLDGIDPDGDSVTLVGVQSPPEQGSVRMEEGRLVYTPAASASGTDTFTYRVADRLGAQATGTVSVGIAQPLTANHPPVALDDEVQVRPGRTFTTNVLANDADPDGDPVSLVRGGLSASDPATALEIVDGRLQVTVPEAPGTVNVTYTIADPAGVTDTGNLSVTVDPEAPLMPPIARDDLVGAEQLDGRESVTVSVLDNDEDPDGTTAGLELAVAAEDEAAGVRADETGITVPVRDSAQTIMYSVTDVDGGVGRAFVLIPGNDHRPPWLTTAEPLQVMAGEALRIDLADHVGVREGRTPRLTGDASATAAPAAAELAVDSATDVVFTAPPAYSGTASVNVTVTDGESGSDPNGLVSTLSIPVSVTPRPEENSPPRVQSSSARIEQGGDPVTVDLAPLASDPDGDDLAFALGTIAGEFAADLEGTVLTLTPSANAERGTAGTVEFTVSDGGSEPVGARIAVELVGTSRPLPRALDDEVPEGRAGEPVTVDVLENDVNPFEGEAPLTVADATAVTGSGTVAFDASSVTITPDAGYSGRMRVTYTVQDLTGDPARQARGNVTVVVKGRPDVPGIPRIEGVDDATVDLSWAAPPDNGDPITGYTVTDTTTGSTQQCAATACTITGLANGVEHRFSVTAANSVGESEPSGVSAPAVPDVRPEMPAAPVPEAGDGVVELAWTAPVNRGSAITDYRVQVSPAPTGAATRSAGTGTALRWDGLQNGVPYRFRIQAVNSAAEPSEWSPWSADVTPAGKPFAPGTPSAARDQSAVDGGVVRLSWSAADDNGAPLSGYTVTAHAGGTSTTRRVAAGTTSMNWTGLDKSTAYSFSVVATNAEGDSPSSGRSATVTPYGLPGAVSGLTTSPTGTDRTLRYSFSPAASNGSPVTYQYSTGGGWASLGTATSGTLTVPANGTGYRLSVRATNAAGAGQTTTVSTANAHGPLKPPAISASSSQGRVSFSWSTNTATAGNGRDATMTATVNGRTIPNSGTHATEWTRPTTTYTLKVTVCADGECASTEREATTGAVPDPTLRFALGAPFGDPESCGANGAYKNCHYSVLNASGFEPNQRITGGTCHGIAARDGRHFTWENGTVDFTVDADGRLVDGNVGCWPTDNHSEVWVVAGGVESNHIRGPW
ncbi:MAG: Ig-like domain-containing protein [Micrococcus sp.]|nr:Ig-like domain-containing protein [Micrococcus sp.]